MEKETDSDNPLDSSGSVGKQFTSDGAVGELHYSKGIRSELQLYPELNKRSWQMC